jgi:hypothetical protein
MGRPAFESNAENVNSFGANDREATQVNEPERRNRMTGETAIIVPVENGFPTGRPLTQRKPPRTPVEPPDY